MKQVFVVAHLSPLAPEGLVYIARGAGGVVETDLGWRVFPQQTFFFGDAHRFGTEETARLCAAIYGHTDTTRTLSAATTAPWCAWSAMVADADGD
jgi:hypothetical protein